MKDQNESLIKRIGVLEAENVELKRKLKTQDEQDRFVDFKGVYWKKKLGGGFERMAFCPSCTFVMVSNMNGFACQM